MLQNDDDGQYTTREVCNMTLCSHNVKIEDSERGEIVCSNCAMVLGENLSADSSTSKSSSSHLSAAHLGSSLHNIQSVAPSIRMSFDSKQMHFFPRICSKLNLFASVGAEAFSIYKKIHKHCGTKRATCAMFAIYVACRNSGQCVEESQIQDAIKIFMYVKNVPSAHKARSELDICAKSIGICTRRPSRYYLNLEMKSCKNMLDDPHNDYEQFCDLAIRYYSLLRGNDANRARRAVRLALDDIVVARTQV